MGALILSGSTLYYHLLILMAFSKVITGQYFERQML